MLSSTRARYVAAAGATIIISGGAITAAQGASGANAAGSSATASNAARPAPSGPTSAQLSAAAKDLGVSTTALRAAIQAARPARPSGPHPGRGDHAATLSDALGVETAAVQEILEASRPSRPADGIRRAPRPAHSELIAALVKGLNVSEARVRAAVSRLEAEHRAEHEAREDAMYATIAKTLKTDADAVETAFEDAGIHAGGPGGRGHGGPGRGETALTGATARKVRAAALARVAGTVLRVETDFGGVYEAHIRRSDGTEVEVKVNRRFEVTAVEEHSGRP